MANWNEYIKIEVRLPYITQICTLGHIRVIITVTASDIWFSGHDRQSRVWKAESSWGDYRLLVRGKTTNTIKNGDQSTTYKVFAKYGLKDIKCKVLSYK